WALFVLRTHVEVGALSALHREGLPPRRLAQRDVELVRALIEVDVAIERRFANAPPVDLHRRARGRVEAQVAAREVELHGRLPIASHAYGAGRVDPERRVGELQLVPPAGERDLERRAAHLFAVDLDVHRGLHVEVEHGRLAVVRGLGTVGTLA